MMKKVKPYLDTTIISFVFADDAPEFRDVTRDLLATCQDEYELYISSVVTLEIRKTVDPVLRHKMIDVLSAYPIVMLSEEELAEVKMLASRYIAHGAIPASKFEDALHVAFATVHEMDILVSWNFRHLANVKREAKILAVNMEAGYWRPLRLLSPLEIGHE